MAVLFKIQALERNLEIQSEKRRQKLSTFNFQQKQKRLFPGAEFGGVQIGSSDFSGIQDIIV